MRLSLMFAIVLTGTAVACDAVTLQDDVRDVPADVAEVGSDLPDVQNDTSDTTEVVLPPGCCLKDEDCPSGLAGTSTCAFPAFTAQGNPGVCKTLPDAGKCWDDGDCLANEGCNGSSFCACDNPCLQPEGQGLCKTLAGPGERCGFEAANCRPGLACCYPCGIQGCDWQCTDPCTAGQSGCMDGCMAYP